MPLSLQDALNSYGFVGTLANAIPELRGILSQAITDEWVPEQFNRAVQDSGWYKRYADSQRQLQALRATDPATYAQNVKNATSKINLMMQQMGLGPRPAGNVQQIALIMLNSNFDDQQIRNYLATSVGLRHGEAGALTGEASQYEAHVREVATNYGVPITDKWVGDQVSFILAGRNSTDGVEAILRARAKAAFPHLAAQIDSGMTVRDVADPYIANMAKTLELDEAAIKLADPSIQKALAVKGADGAQATKPMWEFVRDLKSDPRWDKTDNAKQEAYGVLNQLGSAFGFTS